MSTRRRVRVCILLEPAIATMLAVTAERLGKSRAEVVADGIVRIYVGIPRPDD